MNPQEPTEPRPASPVAISRRTLFSGLAIGATTMISGCSFTSSPSNSTAGAATTTTFSSIESGSATASSAAPGGPSKDKVLLLALNFAIDSLDPHFVNDGSAVTGAGLLEGLVLQGVGGKDVIPAIAEKWEVSGDALTYTFHIRAEAAFSNGDPITAEDFEWTYRRLLTPTGAGGGGTNGTSSYLPSLGIKGALEYQAGTITDWSKVGIKAQSKQLLVIELTAPSASFLLGMSDASMAVLHQASVTKSATEWMKPENWVGSGPYVPTEWSPTSAMTMVAQPHYWDLANVDVGTVKLRVMEDSSTELLAYRNNEVDVTDNEVKSYAKDQALVDQTQSAPGASVIIYQTMFSRHPASRDARVRRALSMAIDRDTMAKIVPGTVPGPALVPDSVPGYDPSLAIAFDVEGAKKLLAEAGFAGGQGMPEIQLLDYKRRPESEALADMWKSNLGLNVSINIVDSGLIGDLRYKPFKEANLWGFSTTAFGGLPTFDNWVVNSWGPNIIPFFSLDADSADAYLAVQADDKLDGSAKTKQLNAITAAHASAEAKKFAADATAAAGIVDDAQRTAAFVAAAKQREALAYEIPILWDRLSYLVRPKVTGLKVRYAYNGFYYKELRIAG